jgi:deoxyribodipyrimidine photo-lyase
MNRCFWFRQDLRLLDNFALKQACSSSSGSLIALYFITPETWRKHCFSDSKVDLILRRLDALSEELSKLNIPLKIIKVKSFGDVPQAILKFCAKYDITSVYCNKQLLLDETQRDNQVEKKLSKSKIEFLAYDEAIILHPNEILKQDGTPFKVFTPFKRSWLKAVTPDRYFADNLPLKKQKKIDLSADLIPKKIDDFSRTPQIAQDWPVSSSDIEKRLVDFCDQRAADYEEKRDFPAVNATSKLSAYLANGFISARQCITALCESFEANDIYQLQKGAGCWLNELIWREFYQCIAYQFPEVVKNQPFKAKTKKLSWSKSQKNFEAWCDGQTGFPLVDAGMRQLNQTGWMHNRLRMVVAMFLTKTLFINWRWGEDYFMRQLIDGEFAANNGGWQWSASTGTDSVPYFRIFNPTTQSERFDKEGVYIRQYCPELADCTNKQIHNPSSELRKELGYPEPIVDYKAMRAKVIAAFKEL